MVHQHTTIFKQTHFLQYDLSICSSDILFDFEYTILPNLYSSDHFPIKLKFINQTIMADSPDRYNISKADWAQFKYLTRTAAEPYNQSVDELLQYITDTITTAANITIPRTNKQNHKPGIPWYNEACKDARRQKIQAERTLRRNYNVVNLIAYKRTKARCRFICRTERKDSWKRYISSIDKETTIHKMWQKVVKVSGKFKFTPTPILKDNNDQLISDHHQVATFMAEGFAAVSSDHNYSPEFLRHKNKMERLPLKFNVNGAENKPYNKELSRKEFNAALSKCNESSPGEDEITYSMIKRVHETMLNLILCLFNRIFTEQTFPQSWYMSIIVPILKPNKNPFITTSYRPISLTNCLCKLLEKIINFRLMWILEKENHVCTAQSGFRKNRSTTDPLVQFQIDTMRAIENKQHTIAIFFDIKKAYDSAWRHGVVRSLFNFGLRGNLPRFIENFLKERYIKVRVGKTFSQPVHVPGGIPQGSVLSCSCFMIAINGITDSIPANVKSTLYVDDFSIYSSGSVSRTVERRLQITINNLEKWCNETGFCLEKMACIHICRNRNCPRMAHQFTLKNTIIECVESYKFLGMIIDNKLNWNKHITNLRTSCNRILDLLKHLSHKSWGADRTCLLRLLIMMLKPKLDYGCEAYSSAKNHLLNKLDVTMNAAIRISTGAYRSSPLVSLYSESGIKPPSTYRKIKLLNYYTRLHINPTHPLHDELPHQIDTDSEYDINIQELDNISATYMNRANNLAITNNINFSNVMMEIPSALPPWQIISVNTCIELARLKKSETSQQELRILHHEHVTAAHNNNLMIYTDGSKSLEGVGYSYVSAIEIFSRRIQQHASVFTAELMAIYDALAYAETSEQLYVTICSDSRSAILAIERYMHPNPLVQLIQCRISQSEKFICLCWTPAHVGVRLNEEADKQAKMVIETGQIDEIMIPRSDIKSLIKLISTKMWKEQWNNTHDNKYREITNKITPLPHALNPVHSWSRCLTRLRIGHCSLTHKFLMTNNVPPYCEDCLVVLTVKHILIECPSYSDDRERYLGTNTSLKDVLVGPLCAHGGPLYQFLRAINILYDI